MTPTEVEALLAKLSPDLDRLAAPWSVIGSGALMLLGVPLAEANDLDIVTSAEGAGRLRSAWAAWLVAGEPKAPDGPFRSDDFARYETPWGTVEVMGGLRVRQDGELRPLMVHGQPLPAAGELLRILRLFGRRKDLAKAERLEAWLIGEPGSARPG